MVILYRFLKSFQNSKIVNNSESLQDFFNSTFSNEINSSPFLSLVKSSESSSFIQNLNNARIIDESSVNSLLACIKDSKSYNSPNFFCFAVCDWALTQLALNESINAKLFKQILINLESVVDSQFSQFEVFKTFKLPFSYSLDLSCRENFNLKYQSLKQFYFTYSKETPLVLRACIYYSALSNDYYFSSNSALLSSSLLLGCSLSKGSSILDFQDCMNIENLIYFENLFVGFNPELLLSTPSAEYLLVFICRIGYKAVLGLIDHVAVLPILSLGLSLSIQNFNSLKYYYHLIGLFISLICFQ
ncbi:hypothetical protein GEMRC1_004496 [Eukaryota sp. GEM-RC1]